jgi:hypothetical protein
MPARTWPLWAVWAAGAWALAISAGLAMQHIFDQPDSGFYLLLSGGQHVMAPFAWRQLGPLLVRAETLAGLRWTVAWYAEGGAALALFVGGVAWMLVRAGAPRWMLVALLGMGFWSFEFNALVLPDLLFGALLCLFLLLLQREHGIAAASMLSPLMLTRESAWLALVCLLAAGWGRLRRREFALAIAASVAGMLAVRLLAGGAAGNQPGLGPGMYLLAKAPWNLLRNVFGVVGWADLAPACAAPVWRMGLHVGGVGAVGVCGFSAMGPVRTLGAALASFGLLPLLGLRMRGWRTEALMLRFSMVYGAVSFAAAPLEGQAHLRLFGYAWPLFVVALPAAIAARGAGFSRAWAAWGFVGLHLAWSWAGLFLIDGTLLGAGVAAYGVGGGGGGVRGGMVGFAAGVCGRLKQNKNHATSAKESQRTQRPAGASARLREGFWAGKSHPKRGTLRVTKGLRRTG